MRFSNGPCFHFMLAAIITLAGRSEGQLDINSIGEGLNQFISKGIDVLRPLLTQTVDFSNIAPGIEILMRNLKINSRRLFSPPELRMLERMLSGLSLDERMKTWGLTAKYLQLFEPSIRQFLLTDLNLFENDVVLTERNIRALIAEAEDQLNATFAPQRRRRKRKIIVNSTEKWNSDVIPWHIETQLFAPSEVAMVRKGLQQWQEETCLTFSEKQNRPAGDYINFNKGFGCASYIGKIGGRQDISLDGDVCFSLGVVMHEIGHALGMWHEQSRPDRDEYVTLVKSNIKLGLLGQFQQRTWDTVDSIAIPYDYGSVMHYGRKDFSFNSQDTLKAKWYGYEQTIGQVSRASFHDVKIVNYWYCKNKCSTYTLEWSLCENDGYQDPRKCDQCKCPDGFKQPFCKEIQDHTIANCGKNELQASPSWRTLESPGYPNMVAGPGACTWRIKAPVGSRVELKFVDDFDLARPSQEACEDYIEVRYRDLALTGPRFCGFNKPFKTFVSEELSILLLLRKVHKKGSYKGFKLQYRAVGCGGCNPNSPRSQHACVETYRYTCGVRFNCNWLGRKFCLRANTCFKTIYTCCAGYQKNGQTCIKI